LIFQEFMQMWVGYELVKVLRIFGLQPTCIREDLKSWSPDLYYFFMYFNDKKKYENREKHTQQILDVLFVKTDHNGHFSAIKFGGKSNIEKMKHKILFLVILTWLRQIQQYFYNQPDRSENCNWSKYGNYCPTVSSMRDTPLANINFAKGDNESEPVKSVDAFRPKTDHGAVILLEEWALKILKPDVPHILKMAIKDNSETKERFNNAKNWTGTNLNSPKLILQ
jgi:hypothetical protein